MYKLMVSAIMKVYEFGSVNNKTIMFLHGGGLSWWNYKKQAEMLSANYHIICVVLDGHGDSEEQFISIETNAERIIEYIDRYYKGSIYCICGLSLGAQILVEILSRRNNICQYSLIESASLIPSKLTNMLVKPSIDSSYFLIKYNWFSKLQFKQLKMDESYYQNYYADSCKISKNSLIAILKSNTAYLLPASFKEAKSKLLVVVGGKELKSMLNSARIITEAIPEATLYIAKDLYHGEFSLNYPEKYVEMLLELFEK